MHKPYYLPVTCHFVGGHSILNHIPDEDATSRPRALLGRIF